MEHFNNSPQFGENWFTFEKLYSEMVKRFNSGSHFVELGSWKGRSSAYMAVEIVNSNKQIKFDCIDSWQVDAAWSSSLTGDEAAAIFLNNIKPVAHIINTIRKDSSSAASDYLNATLDFVFIDADHSYEGVKKDIVAWLPKVKKGGVLAGHDYAWTPGIRQAVDEVFGTGNYSDPWGNGCFIINI
jgi:predicted O-methyltransferase YrrM